MTDQEAPHSMCVTLRIDPATLKEVEQEQGDKSLSATMNIRICGALSALTSNAKEGENDD